jgi:hypothetical protein
MRRSGVDERRRDGALALVTLTLLTAISIRADATGRLFDPVVAVAGCLGMSALEAVFLRYPDRTRAVWNRRPVQGVAVVGVVAIGLAAVRTSGGALALGLLVWGLVGYLVLLGVTVRHGNPIARLASK